MLTSLKNIIYIATLLLFPFIFALFSEWVVMNNDLIKKIVFLFVGFVVITSVYIILSSIFNRYPHFLSRGILGNKFISFIIGAILLSLLTGIYIMLFNSITVSSFQNRLLTLLLAYPVLFVLICMICSFLSHVLDKTAHHLLLVSSYSILGVLAIFMFL